MLDVIVVGAGAAGIGAGLALLRQQARFVVLEAKNRVGGRAYSESKSLGQLWDHGCHWFHAASLNPLRQIALKLGHPFEDVAKPYGTWLWRDGAFADAADYEAALELLAARVAGADVEGRDLALSALMDPASPWHQVVRHDMALTYSHEPEEISVADGKAFRDTGENIPVSGGYGALIARLARLLPVRLSCPVTAITVEPRGVHVATPSGALVAKQVIVAVPQRVLERRMIRFSPGLPEAVTGAIEMLPMGWFEKTGFAFDRPVFGDWAGAGLEIMSRQNGDYWPAPVQISAGPTPIAICHTAGHRARDIPVAERMALCEEALVGCFGTAIRRHIAGRASSAWTTDPFIGGAYSCAKPGYARVRKLLQETVHGAIQFAGEHTSSDGMATAHGAFLSGHAAVVRALALPGGASDPLWLPEGA